MHKKNILWNVKSTDTNAIVRIRHKFMLISYLPEYFSGMYTDHDVHTAEVPCRVGDHGR